MVMKEDYSIKSLNIDEYDFVDFGCSTGRSLSFGEKKLGGKRGIGIDIDIEKVKRANHNIKNSEDISGSHSVVCEDITRLSEQNLTSKVRFTTCIHFLEHLFGIESAEKIIESAINISEEFVFISQPYADMDAQLFKSGFKTYYSDWLGHINLMTSYDFYKICRNFYYRGLIKEFIIFATDEIKDSSSSIILPLESRLNQHEYDANIHPPKDGSIKFTGLYKDINVFLMINDDADFEKTVKNINSDYHILFDSRDEIDRVGEVKLEECDFVDVGFGKGNSLKYGIAKFGGKKGLGIEKNKKRIEIFKPKMGDFKQGYGYHKLINKDVFDLDTRNSKYYKKFRFSLAINFVEELSSIGQFESFVHILGDLSRDFAYISSVNNDYDDYLNSLGFQTTLHTERVNNIFLTGDDYIRILDRLRNEGVIREFVIFKRRRLLDTSHPNICPIDSVNTSVVELDDFYINMDVFMLFKDGLDIEKLSRHLNGEKKLLYSSFEY